MAVSIDTVYQKVLALANKEQRGYITPQEFNLLANKAQLEVYHNYFHEIKTAYHKPKNQTTIGDELEMLAEKLHPFEVDETVLTSEALLPLPLSDNSQDKTHVYKLNGITRNGNEVTELTRKEIMYTEKNPLTKATIDRSVFHRDVDTVIPTTIDGVATSFIHSTVRVYPAPTFETAFVVHYFKKPTRPRWAYVVVAGKALYNSNLTVDFELHGAEEEVLVTRILELSGIIMNKPGLAQIAQQDKMVTKQQQNS